MEFYSSGSHAGHDHRGKPKRDAAGSARNTSARMNFYRFLPAALLLAAAICLCSFTAAQENPQPPKQTIQVNVERVNVGVIVTDHGGHFVEGLRREDFRAFDNGIEQPLIGFT